MLSGPFHPYSYSIGKTNLIKKYTYHVQGTYTWIFLWAEKVPDLNRAKYSAGFPKKTSGT